MTILTWLQVVNLTTSLCASALMIYIAVQCRNIRRAQAELTILLKEIGKLAFAVEVLTHDISPQPEEHYPLH